MERTNPLSSISDLLRPEVLGELRRMELRTRRSLSADLCGRYRSAFRGTGLVYSDLREYQPGDEIRHIHWKATARSRKVYVKSFDEDRSLQIMLIVDISRSTSFGVRRSFHQQAFEFAALVAMLAQQNGDACGMCLFSESVVDYLAPKRSRRRFQQLLVNLLEPKTLGPESNLTVAIDEVQKRQRKKSLVFVVSDFFCPPFDQELSRLAAKHDVICSVLDDAPMNELHDCGMVEYVDSESGERLLIDTSDKKVRTALHARHQRRLAELKQRFLLCGADYMNLANGTLNALAGLMAERTGRRRFVGA